MRCVVALGSLCVLVLISHSAKAARLDTMRRPRIDEAFDYTLSHRDDSNLVLNLAPWTTPATEPRTESWRSPFNDNDAEPQQWALVPFAVKFIWSDVLDADTKREIQGWFRQVVESLGRVLVPRPVRGRTLGTTLQISGEDNDDDGDPDEFTESDGVDYDSDGTDDETYSAKALSLRALEDDIADQLRLEDAWLRRHRR